MPCRDYEPTTTEYERAVSDLRKNKTFLSAALCASLRALEDVVSKLESPTENNASSLDIYKYIDFEEAGITRLELMTWHVQHKEQDRLRRIQEEKKREADALRKSALSKLTKEERAILGIR